MDPDSEGGQRAHERGASVENVAVGCLPLGNIDWLPMNGHNGSRFQFGYDPNTNHFVGQSYDANGNLLADGAHSYSWDAEGNMISVSDTSTTTVIYDALGRRVEQNGGGASAELLYGPDGSKLAVMSGQTVVKGLVPLPGGATAVYNSTGLAWYRHPDWLGSSRIASTPTTRTMYYDGAYSPFGETMAEAGTADAKNNIEGWRKAVHDAARSGRSIREFCRQRKLHERQFCWWQRHIGSCGPARWPERSA